MGCCSSKNAVVTPLEASSSSFWPQNTSVKRPVLGKAIKPGELATNHEKCNVFDIVNCPPYYPRPLPPSTNRENYLHNKNFTDIEKFAKQAPQEVLDDYVRLVEYFKKPVRDLDKVYAILRWLTRVRRLGLLKEAGTGHDEDNFSIGGSSQKQFGLETNKKAVTKSIINQESVRQFNSKNSEESIRTDPEVKNKSERKVKDDNLEADNESDQEASIRNVREGNNQSNFVENNQSNFGLNSQSHLGVNVREGQSEEQNRVSIHNSNDNNQRHLGGDQASAPAYSNTEVENQPDQRSNMHSIRDVNSRYITGNENGYINDVVHALDENAGAVQQDVDSDVDKGSEHLDQNSNRFECFKRKGVRHTPKGDLQLVHEQKVDVAVMFAVICRKAQIKCSVIPGRIKTHQYEVGGTIEDGRWNAVFLDEEWRLIHVHWCGFRLPLMATRDEDNIEIENSKRNHQFDDHFFLTDPAKFVTRCLPNDEKWQLLRKPVPFEKFKRMPHYTEQFHKLDLWMPNEQEGIVNTMSGRASLKIEFPVERQPQLYYHIREKEVETDGSGSSLVMDPTLIRRCVYMYKKERFYYLQLRFNKRGRYILQIHGRHVTSVDSEHDEAPLLCQFEVVCKEPDEQWRPLPISPAIGWGQSGMATYIGIIALSHKHGIVFLNEYKHVNMMFKLTSNLELKAEILDCVTQEREQTPTFSFKKDKAVLNIVLSSMGEKYLRIFAKDAEMGQFVNVHNFIVKPKLIYKEKERARDRRLKNNLETAMESGSEQELRRAIRDYEMFIHTDTGELDKGEERLAFLVIKGRLFESLQREFIPLMQVAIYDAEHCKFSEELQSQIQVLKAHLEKLQQSAPFRKHVLPLNQSLMEIRSYMTPSSIIYDVMVAALRLLGEKRNNIKDWKYVRGLMARTGRESILHRMETFDPGTAGEERLREVEELHSCYTLQQVWEASAGAAVIHKWTGKAIGKVRGKESTEQMDRRGNAPVENLIRDETSVLHLESSRLSHGRKSGGSRKRKASGSLEDDSEDESTTARNVVPEVDNSESTDSLDRRDKRLKSDEMSGQLGNGSSGVK